MKANIEQHINTEKHKRCISSASCSRSVDTFFFIKKDSDQETKVIAAEVTMAFHTVKHHQSFSSNDCVSQLCSTVFPDSKVAGKFPSARTKSTAMLLQHIASNKLSM